MSFTNRELHLIVELLDVELRLAQTSDRVLLAQSTRDKAARLVASASAVRALGIKVFELRLPLNVKRELPATPARPAKGKRPAQPARPARTVTRPIAPRLNEYGSMPTWQRAALYKDLDLRIMAELARWPASLLRGNLRPRAVVVTRYSSVQPDEITVDVIGGKVPIDRMVHAGILRGDNVADLQREARWKQSPPGEGALVIEVFDFA